jgi:hypothetical protein
VDTISTIKITIAFSTIARLFECWRNLITARQQFKCLDDRRGRLLDNIPVSVIPPSSEGLNCGLNITSTKWIDLSGGIHNEHVSRAANCSRHFGDDSMCHLCAGQDYHP